MTTSDTDPQTISKTARKWRARKGLTGAALTAPPYANKKRYEVRGEMLTANEIADKYDMNLSTVRHRASSGYDGEAIIRTRHRAASTP